jgi:hypothetical protein
MNAIVSFPVMAPIDPRWTAHGASSEAKSIAKLTQGAIVSLRRNDHDRAFAELRNLRESCATDGRHLSDRTYLAARRFLLALPAGAAAPEASLDPDGEIAFDWFGSAGRNFSVSVRADGRLSYAGQLGLKVSLHGTDQLDETIPRRILDAVESVVVLAKTSAGA